MDRGVGRTEWSVGRSMLLCYWKQRYQQWRRDVQTEYNERKEARVRRNKKKKILKSSILCTGEVGGGNPPLKYLSYKKKLGTQT